MSNFRTIIEEYGLETFGRFYGVYVGIVIQDYDPENMGRIAVRIPEVKGPNQVVWASAMNVFSGSGYGSYIIPTIGEWVYIQFRNGDPKLPLWSFGGYAKGELPAEFNSTSVAGLKTPKGHLVFIDDATGIITIRSANGVEVLLNDEAQTIDLKAGITISMKKEELKVEDNHLAIGEKVKGVFDDLAGLLDVTNVSIFPPNPSLPGTSVINTAAFKLKLQSITKKFSDILTKYS